MITRMLTNLNSFILSNTDADATSREKYRRSIDFSLWKARRSTSTSIYLTLPQTSSSGNSLINHRSPRTPSPKQSESFLGLKYHPASRPFFIITPYSGNLQKCADIWRGRIAGLVVHEQMAELGDGERGEIDCLSQFGIRARVSGFWGRRG